MAEMPLAICIMASVMMKDGMPTIVTPNALIRPSVKQLAKVRMMAITAVQRQVGDVHVVRLQREEGHHDTDGIGDRSDRQVDLGGQDDEGQSDGNDARDRDLRENVHQVVERSETRARLRRKKYDQCDQREDRRNVAHLIVEETA